MNDFEEWKNKNFKPKENLVDTEDYLEGYEDGLEHGWEAALKRVQSAAWLCVGFAVEKFKEWLEKELASFN